MRKTSPRHASVFRSALPWVLLHLCLLAIPASAQSLYSEDDSPVTPLRITDRGGELGLEFDYLGETQKFGQSKPLKFSNASFEEYLQYYINGYIYHPSVVDFRTQFKIGMLQQMIESPSNDLGGNRKSSSNTFLREYDFFLSFFKNSPLLLDLYARREHDVVRQLFTDRIFVDNETIGGDIGWRKGAFPMSLSIRQNKSWEQGFDSQTQSTAKILDYTVRNAWSNRMRTELRYRYQDYEQNFDLRNPRFNTNTNRKSHFTSNDVSLDNMLFLTSNHESYLQSYLRLFSETGDQEIRNFSWHERLQFQHTPNLRSYYLLNYLRNQARQSVIETYQTEAGIDHRLFKSLNTHFDTHWKEVDYPQASNSLGGVTGRADSYTGVTGRADYRKHTPWGNLTSGYAVTVDDVQLTGRSGIRSVLDEALTLIPTIPQFLANNNVILGSILITDVGGLTTYAEGFDYEVDRRGARTGIRLLLGGRITEGATVLVDYTFQSPTDINYISTAQSFNVRYDFERYLRGLSLYYRWHNLEAGGSQNNADLANLAMTDRLLGASYAWRWLTWTEEFERFTSVSTGYDQLRSQIEGRHLLTGSTQWMWNVGALQTQYTAKTGGLNGLNHSEALYASTGFRGSMLGSGHWELEGSGRRETGVTDELLLGFLGQVGMKWRQLNFSAGARIEQRDEFNTSRNRVNVFFQVSRKF